MNIFRDFSISKVDIEGVLEQRVEKKIWKLCFHYFPIFARCSKWLEEDKELCIPTQVSQQLDIVLSTSYSLKKFF